MFVAISPIGADFMYKRSSILEVSKAAAEDAARVLNSNKTYLKPGEVWSVHDGPADSWNYCSYGKITRRCGVYYIHTDFGFNR